MAEKTVNYTAEQTVAVLEAYASGTDVATIAESMGKTSRSIIAKLSREGVYQKKVYTSKTGEAVQKKDETADAIGKILGLTEAETESLTKANKTALKIILAALS
jgi:response regulator RpfG family c-di-GMP phosphodiesterase